MASVKHVQILSSNVSMIFALCCRSQSTVGALGGWEQAKVTSELGTGPGIKLDSLILVPELQQPGLAGASLVLFIQLSFDFWSLKHHLLTVPNSYAILLRIWETKTAKQEPLMLFFAVVSGWNWLRRVQAFSCYIWWDCFLVAWTLLGRKCKCAK